MRSLLFSPLSLAGLLVLCFPALGSAQSFLNTDLKMISPQYEAEASRLRTAEPQQYDFSKAMLSDVLRFLSTDAGISFFSLPDDSPEGSKLITFSIKASPFQVLETLCKANGLALIPDNGIWYIRPADDRELLGKSYSIKHNPLEMVEKVLEDTASSSSTTNSAGNGVPPNGLDMQGIKETFATKRSQIINDIRSILDLPPEDEKGNSAGSVPIGGIPGGQTDPNAAVNASNSNQLSATHQPKIIWKSDSNTLYVVATRLQHMWVEGYLEAADKPQPLIAIEVKFIETSDDPKREFGVDWSGTFGETGTYRQVSKYDFVPAEVDSTTGRIIEPAHYEVEYQSLPTTGGGYRADLSDLLQPENLTNFASNMVAPTFGILSAQDVSVKLRALLRDEDTKTVSYPRMVTMNNREVALRSVVNQPVLAASSSSSLGTGATTTSSVAYLPIGTVLNILPKKLENDKVLLNIAVTLSSIIGSQNIQGNPYPIATSRVYSAPVEVNSGYTVAIGGLDEAREREGETGVPFVSQIPILGYLFKYKSKERNHKNLMLFITPYLMDAKEGGLPDEPQTVVRQKPGGQPDKPRIDGQTGALMGGVDAVPASVEYIKTETEKLTRTVDEGRSTKEDTKKLSELRTAVYHLKGQVRALMQAHPERMSELKKADDDLADLLLKIGSNQRKVFAKKYF